MRHRTATFAAAGVLLFHTAAFAQQPGGPTPAAPGTAAGPAQPAPPPAAAPAPPAYPPPPPAAYPPPPYGPPPGYAPPPGYGYPQGYAYPPRGAYGSYYVYPAPVRPSGLTYRPFTIGVGLGFGALTVDDEQGTDSWSGVSYAVRLGFGLTRRWLALLSFEGLGVTAQSSDLSHQTWMIGAQAFVTDRLYARGGIGFSRVSEDLGGGFESDIATGGRSAMLGAGIEVLQGHFASMAFEWSGTASRFPHRGPYDSSFWFANAFNLVLNFY